RPVIITVYPSTLDGSVRCSGRTDDYTVERVFSFNTSKHFALFRRYPGWLAIPDWYWTWPLFFRLQLRRLEAKYRPELVWSTHPTPSAHTIASLINRKIGVPWIADFRDPLVFEDATTSRLLRNSRFKLERRVALSADH